MNSYLSNLNIGFLEVPIYCIPHYRSKSHSEGIANSLEMISIYQIAQLFPHYLSYMETYNLVLFYLVENTDLSGFCGLLIIVDNGLIYWFCWRSEVLSHRVIWFHSLIQLNNGKVPLHLKLIIESNISRISSSIWKTYWSSFGYRGESEKLSRFYKLYFSSKVHIMKMRFLELITVKSLYKLQWLPWFFSLNSFGVTFTEQFRLKRCEIYVRWHGRDKNKKNQTLKLLFRLYRHGKYITNVAGTDY